MISAKDHNDRAYIAKAKWHYQQAQLPIKEKVAILLQLQRQDLPLLACHRPLRQHEKPWDIEP